MQKILLPIFQSTSLQFLASITQSVENQYILTQTEPTNRSGCTSSWHFACWCLQQRRWH